jgi:hypothetical protein
MGKKKQLQEKPDRSRALACTPIRNPEVEEQKISGGILLRYPVEVKPWFQSIFKRLSSRKSNIIMRRLELDALGSSVWEMVDGRQTVAGIAEKFRKTHQLGTREAELSVTGFLRDLGKRSLIAMKEEDRGQ